MIQWTGRTKEKPGQAIGAPGSSRDLRNTPNSRVSHLGSLMLLLERLGRVPRCCLRWQKGLGGFCWGGCRLKAIFTHHSSGSLLQCQGMVVALSLKPINRPKALRP